MIKKITFTFGFVLILFFAQAQNFSPNGGGKYDFKSSECISKIEKIKIEHQIDSTITYLKKMRAFDKLKKTRSVALSWPLKQAVGFNYCNYYAISNYVDHDLNYPNQIQDFNCGTRSYDLSSGYNHSGTDIFLWPFDWNMMNDNQVEIIAAAPGIIVGKYDGNFDQNCSISGASWNAIYVLHNDGSVAWYGHMKSGTLTTKNVGDMVIAGEKLGNIGSSGSSTGPHLHFELHDSSNNIIDPYFGPCNTNPTWWSPAKSYEEPTVNVALTHSFPPAFNACPAPATTNIKDTFSCSEDIYFAGYFRDEILNQTATYIVKRPNGSVFNSWTFASIANYSASYWYWYDVIPINAPSGTWTFEITYNGQTCTHPFEVVCNTPLPISEIKLSAFNNNNETNLKWNVDDESQVKQYEIEVSLDGKKFDLIGSVFPNNQNTNQFVDKTEYKSNRFYRIKSISLDEKIMYSNIVEIKIENMNKGFLFFPNPVKNEINVQGSSTPIQIYSIENKLLLESSKSPIDVTNLSNGIYILHANESYYKFTINK